MISEDLKSKIENSIISILEDVGEKFDDVLFELNNSIESYRQEPDSELHYVRLIAKRNHHKFYGGELVKTYFGECYFSFKGEDNKVVDIKPYVYFGWSLNKDEHELALEACVIYHSIFNQLKTDFLKDNQ